ncbi:MAG: hypothetical protein A2V70_08795 [Planctomycetes bacterium RBG_13_63_9]|nr:MAG: hypothetical protein A2V70_08795 [Planctomycetes bacterium RBG_13_63_9]
MLPKPEINFQRTPVTLIIMAIVVALELVCTFDPERRFYYASNVKLGMLSLIWEGELWRPFTSSLLHVSFIHALFNVYWLAIFGRVLEPRFGSLRFLGVIVLLAYVSTMPEFIIDNYNQPVDQQIGSVGFSGVGYGLFGMLWIGRRWRPELREVCNDAIVKLFVGWFFFCIVVTYLNVMPVGNIAHGTGCAFGVLYGMAAFAPRHRIRWIVLAAVASGLVLSTLIACPGHRGYEEVRQRAKQRRQIERLFQSIRQTPPVEQPLEHP